MYRLLALDVDGTILRSDRGLSARTVRALKRARQGGLEYTLVTGRQWAEASIVARKLDLRLPVVCQNGAHILDPRTGKELLHRLIPLAAALELTRVLEAAEVVYYWYVDQRILVPKRFANPLLWGSRWRLRSVTSLVGWLRWLVEARRDLNIEPVDDMAAALRSCQMAPTSLTVWSAAPPLVESLSDDVRSSFDLIQNDGGSWNIVPAGVSKQHGLAFLADHLGLEQRQVVAVGDSYNDLPMLQWAGLSVAMGNAPAEVQAVSHRVTSPNDEDGVAVLVDQLLEAR